MSGMRRINSSRKNSLDDKVRYDAKVGSRQKSIADALCRFSSYALKLGENITLCPKQIIRTLFVLISLIFVYYFLSNLNLNIVVTAEPIFDCSSSHETYNMSFNLTLKEYRDYSISVDNEHCSIVGKNIIEKGGSAVDAAIAAGLCNGLMNAQSAGLGGGHFMVIYLKERKKAYAINARERAPMNSFENMFAEKSSLRGGLATAIPGEIAGFAEAHRIGGRLPWRDLFEPAIRMCSEGYRVSSALAQAIANHEESIRADPVLAEIFINKTTDRPRQLGELVQRPRLARTLMRLAEKGSKAFYDDSTLTGFIIDEINSNGGNVTLKDFQNYRAEVSPALTVDLGHDLKLSTVSLPSSGVLTAFIMRIMNKFKLNKRVLDKSVNEGLFYHRLIESFKHAFAHRSLLGDDKTEAINQILERLQDEAYIREVQLKINDYHTYPSEYYSKIEPTEDHGTAHISVMVGGDAVSLTSTINTYFGAKYAGRFTGIIYNNEMDDFSTPNRVNYFNLEPSEANFIRPGKRPMSSMSPIIVVDKRSDEPTLVLGASGGSKIITAVAQVAIKTLWMDVNIKDAIDERRVHHQLYPQEAQLENGFNANIHRLLLRYGHNVSCHEIGGSIIQAVHRVEKHKLLAYGDPRKGGIPAGA